MMKTTYGHDVINLTDYRGWIAFAAILSAPFSWMLLAMCLAAG